MTFLGGSAGMRLARKLVMRRKESDAGGKVLGL
jgi:hypothetical protein